MPTTPHGENAYHASQGSQLPEIESQELDPEPGIPISHLVHIQMSFFLLVPILVQSPSPLPKNHRMAPQLLSNKNDHINNTLAPIQANNTLAPTQAQTPAATLK